jgi:hypothetical protein
MVIYVIGCGSGRPKNIRIRITNTVHKERKLPHPLLCIVPAVALYLGHDVNGLLCNGNILVLNLEQKNGLVRVGAVHRVRMLRGPGGKNKFAQIC